jgi:adenosylcobinamide-phosphate synthase
MSTLMLLAAPLSIAVALGVDAAFGELPTAVHPVVLMGRLLDRFGQRLPEKAPAAAFICGAAAWVFGATLVTGIAWIFEYGVHALLRAESPSIQVAVAVPLIGVLLKPLLAWRMLREEVIGAESALARSIDAGRTRVSQIAGRDTTRLSAVEVRETAIESLAENLSDSVVAPLFWFAIAGLPGAAFYRFANTADAQWGRRGRWEWAGKWAARADDVLSWIPARLTAIAVVPPGRWRALLGEARQTASPNGGWPMGAMALRLGVHLGRPGYYVLNRHGRDATPVDTARAVRLANYALGGLLLPIVGIAVLMECAR